MVTESVSFIFKNTKIYTFKVKEIKVSSQTFAFSVYFIL